MADLRTVTDFYGRWASVYDFVARYTPGIASIRAGLIEEIRLESGETVAEMGCGTGANLPYLREQVGPTGRVIGIDVTPGVLSIARDRIRRSGWSNVHVVRGDATRPPIGSVDALIATFVVGMLDDPAAAVEAWCDQVGVGGRIGLLDATRTDRRILTPANGLFRAFVTLTTPPGSQVRYPDPPTQVLDRRVQTARRAVADRCTRISRTRRGLGFLDRCVGTVGPPDPSWDAR